MYSNIIKDNCINTHIYTDKNFLFYAISEFLCLLMLDCLKYTFACLKGFLIYFYTLRCSWFDFQNKKTHVCFSLFFKALTNDCYIVEQNLRDENAYTTFNWIVASKKRKLKDFI